MSYIPRLKEFYKKMVEKYKDEDSVTVSDVFESTISFSFRVYLNGNTIIFCQSFKDE